MNGCYHALVRGLKEVLLYALHMVTSPSGPPPYPSYSIALCFSLVTGWFVSPLSLWIVGQTPTGVPFPFNTAHRK